MDFHCRLTAIVCCLKFFISLKNPYSNGRTGINFAQGLASTLRAQKLVKKAAAETQKCRFAGGGEKPPFYLQYPLKGCPV